ncbi:MFS transporter [Serratia rubidaea]|uniref:Inner membrane transport protein RhmT n=1 Tax=Serratia rubidaea TaxID=61652 RepID=A0A3S4X4J9_SERRU|nr:MFS transporter [Serratia rubidaea]MBH1928483.1 MFS transporter [Serratia rubidaea]VEI72456.1 Inner membrane transport protein RhmT [Serratia rubidaea]
MTLHSLPSAPAATPDAVPEPHEAMSNRDFAQSETVARKAFWRILPFIFLCYVVSYLDRTNVSFAALGMNADLGITAEQFGFGAGMFFIGYFLFEVPSNLIMQKVGARIWIARIMISWGVISMLTAFVTGPVSFTLARFCLGVAEAGFTPGIYLFFTYWFPGNWRARITASFLVGIPVANIIGAPVSGALMQLTGHEHIRNWQWLLLIEGLPAVILGIMCLFYLQDKPEKAAWLNAREKSLLNRRLDAERRQISAAHGSSLRDAVRNPLLYLLAMINFCGIVGSIGVGLWMPQIIKQLGVSHGATGYLTAIPYVCGAFCMLFWARRANRSHRIRWIAGALLIAAAALVASAVLDDPLYKIMALCVTVSGILSFQASFWALPSGFLTGNAAAGGLAMIVSIGNLGGFVGPSLMGYIRQSTDGFMWPLLVVALFLFIGAVGVSLVKDPYRQQE